MNKKPTLTLAICTRQRPGMLKECLQSVSKIQIPQNFILDVLVIENDIESRCKGLVESFGTNFRYVNEPEIGLSYARNRALKEAAASRWLLFIDDDETVASSILIEYQKAILKFNAHVYEGRVIYKYPSQDKLPKWFNTKQSAVPALGDFQRNAATGNVLFSQTVIKNFTFDTKFNLSGGEDSFFFLKIIACGLDIISVPDAIAYETVSLDRITLKYQLYRSLSSQANKAKSLMLRENIIKSLAILLFKASFKLTTALFALLFYPFLYVLKFKKRHIILFSILRKIAGAIGIFFGVFDIKTNRYKHIQGY